MSSEKNSGIHYGWIILAVSVITVFASLGFGRFGYTMIFPAMKAGLGLTDSQAGDLATGNMIGYLALALTCGFLSSRFSPRAIIAFFMVLLSAAMALTGLAENFSAAFAGRVLAGMGSGGTNIPVLAIVIAWFAPSRRGLAAGITVSGSSFALLVTGLLIPPVLSHYGAEGWRWSWFILSGGALLAAVICAAVLRNSPADRGLSPIGSSADEPVVRQSPLPLMQSIKLVYRSLAVWHLAGIYTLYGFSYIIYATFFVRYLNWEGGFTVADAGKLWSTVGAVSIASGFIWGSVSDRIGRRHGLFFVYFIQFASYMVFGLWKSEGGFYLSALLFALTAWSIPAIMAAASGDILGPRTGSAALGFITLFFGIGQTAGPFAAGRIADMTGSYTAAFVIAGIASLAGALLCLSLKPIARDTENS
jgi:predicted MFS family arabinose efflux permease